MNIGYVYRLYSIPDRQKIPVQPATHSESHIPLALLQPTHVSLHFLEHSLPNDPCGQAENIMNSALKRTQVASY